MITSIPIRNGKKIFELKQELKFFEECKFSERRKFLTCRVNSKNPLSGATYERVEKGYEECGNLAASGKYPAYVLQCIKGCSSVPSELPVLYGCH